MYNGLIKGSRTLDALALYSFLSVMFPVAVEFLPALGADIKHMAAFNLIMNMALWYLRMKTTTPVGQKDASKN